MVQLCLIKLNYDNRGSMVKKKGLFEENKVIFFIIELFKNYYYLFNRREMIKRLFKEV